VTLKTNRGGAREKEGNRKIEEEKRKHARLFSRYSSAYSCSR